MLSYEKRHFIIFDLVPSVLGKDSFYLDVPITRTYDDCLQLLKNSEEREYFKYIFERKKPGLETTGKRKAPDYIKFKSTDGRCVNNYGYPNELGSQYERNTSR